MPATSDEVILPNGEGSQVSVAPPRRLPTEILIAIADHLCERDFVAFGTTCYDLYSLLVKKQRRSLKVVFDGLQNDWWESRERKYRLLNQQAAILIVSVFEGNSDCFQDELGFGRSRNRRVRVPKNKWDAASQLFGQNKYQVPESIKDLTLSGCFPYQINSGKSVISHPLIRSSGFKSIRPETFKVDLGWDAWNFDILHEMSVTNLKVLKLPIRLPADCVRLGKALKIMPNLASLTITDIPDREEFVAELEHIGEGIMSRASTLRELDIEMTNFNRPRSWDSDQPFIEPEDEGFFFRKLFPCPSQEKLFALCERALRDYTAMIDEVPLRLTRLRLKHVSLPWYSFGMILNAMTIKHLHLPYSMVEDEVWEFLEHHTQLDSLTDVSYDMLSPRFLRFLGEQSRLKELSFARPQDQYEAADVRFYGADLQMEFRVSEEAPRLGPDAGVEYPSIEDFKSSIIGLTMLKHLVLPADMYTITGDFLLCLATHLTGLEHLELGFDYNDPELQQRFTSCFLCGPRSPKKITFFSLEQPQPLSNFDTAHLHDFIASLGERVSTDLKLVRYMPLTRAQERPCEKTEVYYHRERPVDGGWWMYLPLYEHEQIFEAGRTPDIVPVGKWDWEI